MLASVTDKHLEDRVKELLKSIPVEIVKEFINAYYSLKAQELINDKRYVELEKLE
jgi:hypothetical protein